MEFSGLVYIITYNMYLLQIGAVGGLGSRDGKNVSDEGEF
jgi:hypothetical protein